VVRHDIEIINNMEKECSDEFVKDILPIIKSYEDMKFNNGNNANFGSIKTLVINTENWPF